MKIKYKRSSAREAMRNFRRVRGYSLTCAAELLDMRAYHLDQIERGVTGIGKEDIPAFLAMGYPAPLVNHLASRGACSHDRVGYTELGNTVYMHCRDCEKYLGKKRLEEIATA